MIYPWFLIVFKVNLDKIMLCCLNIPVKIILAICPESQVE